MKVTATITCLFAAVAMAIPAPAPAPAGGVVDARHNEATLDKRGCPAGSACQSGQCYWSSCNSSGWCSWNPSGISC
ncbi:hypothetical protein N657DRAFT_645681 [Parathielavia appendiculata]|uniref:Chitin-binding type-1 domain-containing protein n=1 Tax=Parathielavia appendiculata TaxID=2587402 RepID=A0AAN6Z2A9_9PEZI|nr:hypothetical protein N657DRAFT_645681 [Parathielavia appendiculata]